MCVNLVTNYKKSLCLPTRVIPPSTKSCFARGSNTYFLHQMQSHTFYKMQFSGFFLLIFCFSLLKYTYYYNYRSHISLQVTKLAKSAGVQILIFPTVCHTRKMIYTEFEMCYISSQIIKNSLVRPVVHKTQVNTKQLK